MLGRRTGIRCYPYPQTLQSALAERDQQNTCHWVQRAAVGSVQGAGHRCREEVTSQKGLGRLGSWAFQAEGNAGAKLLRWETTQHVCAESSLWPEITPSLGDP